MSITVASGKRGTYKATSAVDTFIINDDTKGATITNVTGGDIIAIEGFSADFTAKVSGRTVTLTSTVDTAIVVKFQLANATGATASVRFLDGDLTATYTAAVGKTKAHVDLGTQLLTTKAVAVSDAALGANDSVSTFDETSGGGSSSTGTTFTLTTGVDAGASFTGGTGDDTFSAVSDNFAATPDVDTLNAADILVGGLGTDTLDLVVTTTDAAALHGALISGIEIINVRAAGAAVTATVDASGASGATAVNANLGAGAVTVTSLATGAAIGVIGNGTVTNGAVTFSYATVTDAITLNVVGGTKVATTVTNAALGAATTATINSTGAANVLGAVTLNATAANTVTALNINATTGLTATLVGADYAVAGATLTVTGAGAVNVGAAGTFKTITASGNTGGLTMTLDTVTTSFAGSTGNDVITTATLAAPAAGIINGGTGTDTLVVAAAADVASAALRGSYTGFETLNNATNAAIAADGIAGATTLITSVAGGGFTGMTAGQAASVSVTADLAATGTTYALTTATGTSDVLGLNIASATATTELDATALTVDGFETLNLTVGSGVKTLYNAAGTTALIAGTDYSNLDFAAAANLKAITLAGAYAAKVDASTFATVTSINASANTGGANIVTGGNTGALTVTGSATRDIVTIGAAGVGGTTTVNTGAGNDSITATQAIIAVATINGGADVDTLTVSDAGTVTVADNNFATTTAIEKLALGAVTGLTFSIGGYANGLATANGGVLDVTAASLATTAGVTIDATGLASTNSLKLSLTQVDAAANASAFAITLSQGADNITIASTGAGNTDTYTITGGVAALAATTAKTIDLSGIATSGAISVTTGAGADVVKASVTAGTYVLGAGADTFTGGAGIDNVTGNAGVDSLTGAAGSDVFVFTDVDTDIDTSAGAVTDVITDFVTAADTLDFDTAGGVIYAEQLTAAADLTALLAAADTALNGTIQYYFGVVGTDGYLVQDVDGIGYTSVIKLTGLVDMAAADIV